MNKKRAFATKLARSKTEAAISKTRTARQEPDYVIPISTSAFLKLQAFSINAICARSHINFNNPDIFRELTVSECQFLGHYTPVTSNLPKTERPTSVLVPTTMADTSVAEPSVPASTTDQTITTTATSETALDGDQQPSSTQKKKIIRRKKKPARVQVDASTLVTESPAQPGADCELISHSRLDGIGSSYD